VSEFGYNQSEGTVVAEFATLSTEGARGNDGVFSLEADGDDLQRVYIAASDALNWQMRVGGSTTFATALVNPLVENLTHKIAISFESGRQDGCIDGNSVTSFGTATTMPATASLVKVGYINTGDFLNGHIKSLRYYPRALTATQIQELTS
jgi:hypothetical protein